MGREHRIGFMITTLGLGGAERVISNIANKFASLPSVKVYFIVKYKVSEEYELHPSIKRINVFERFPKSNPLKAMFNHVNTVRQICKENDIDVLVNFMAVSNIKGILATLGLRTKCIVSVRDDPNSEYGKWYLRLLAKKLFTLADGVVFQTHEEAQWFGDTIQRKGVIIPNPVNRKFCLTEEEYNNIKERKNIVAVGRLEQQKNHLMLLKAFRKIKNEFPKEKLIIYGKGSYYENIKEFIKKYGMEERVDLAGVSYNIHEKIKNAKLFVMTSNHEGIPNAMLEAMTLGLPVICTDCPAGGPREFICDGKDGLLVEVENVESLVKAMRKMLLDNNLRKRLGEEARKKSKIFSEEVVFEQWKKYIAYCMDV